jgi:sec-independent protein translocase protein TatA
MSGRIGELLLILFLVLILFGAGKLPKVMGELGRGLKAFRDAMNGNSEEKTPTETSDKEL